MNMTAVTYHCMIILVLEIIDVPKLLLMLVPDEPVPHLLYVVFTEIHGTFEK